METQKSSNIQPTSGKNRIQYLDILRGIAILFIFIANIQSFSGDYYHSKETIQGFPTHAADNVFYYAIMLLVDAKFYSIFSLLFGIGFAIQYHNFSKSNRAFAPFFSRRMLVLLGIGLLHIYIWLGDILVLYSLVGLLLILFRNQSNKGLLIWAGIMMLMPFVHHLMMAITDCYYAYPIYGMFGDYCAGIGLPEMGFKETMLYYLDTENVSEYLKISLGLPMIRAASILNEGRMFKVLAMFLLGVWAGRQILQNALLENQSFLKKVAVYGLAIGIPGNLLRLYIDEGANGDFWGYIEPLTFPMAIVPLSLAYAALIGLWLQKRPTALQWIAPVGRMALSSYVSQTLISIAIFYGIGFGVAGSIGLSIAVLIALGVYALQIVLSSWYLARYKFGPLEWLWRKLTYIRHGKDVSE